MLNQPLFNPTGGYASYIVPAAFLLILQQTLFMGVASLGAARIIGIDVLEPRAARGCEFGATDSICARRTDPVEAVHLTPKDTHVRSSPIVAPEFPPNPLLHNPLLRVCSKQARIM